MKRTGFFTDERTFWHTGGIHSLVLPVGLPDLPMHVRHDALSSVFLFLLGSAAAGISIFSAGYFRSGEGTLLFIGTRRIGPTGRLELDVALPDHPGRWRIAAVAIADDGVNR